MNGDPSRGSSAAGTAAATFHAFDMDVFGHTESVCPECLRRIPARRIAYGTDLYLEKTCPEHGNFRTVIWRGQPSFASWVRPKTAAHPQNPFTASEQGCPFDCGLCPDHRQHSCCILLEVTRRCDLRCPVCFAGAGGDQPADPDLERIQFWYRRLLQAGGPYNIQLSGGEPCLRDDLPGIIALGRSMGFTFFQLNTNGLRLARDPAYLQALVQAGLSTVFLQFDSLHDEVYRQLRGRPILAEKCRAIEQCRAQGVGVVLVPTLVPGLNTQEIGALVEFALQHMPTVRGVHFQPISYFGRYPTPPRDEQRFTLPEVIQALEEQSHGRLHPENFSPPGGENALCSFHGNFVYMPDGLLVPLNHRQEPAGSCCCPEDGARGAERSRNFVAHHWTIPAPANDLPVLNGPSLGGWDVFLQRLRTHTFCLSGMVFQDAWTLDLERLRDCYIHHVHPDGRLVPFCAYNLTSRTGVSLYRAKDPVGACSARP